MKEHYQLLQNIVNIQSTQLNFALSEKIKIKNEFGHFFQDCSPPFEVYIYTNAFSDKQSVTMTPGIANDAFSRGKTLSTMGKSLVIIDEMRYYF